MPNLYLAPLAGITDKVFRRLCFEQGCDGATTEMVSAQGYLTAPPDRNAYRFLLARFPEEGPLAVQIFGSEPPFMAQAAAKLTELGCFSSIDMNMGCPAQKVVGGQSGSALMKDPDLAAEIVRQVKRATPLPVTVKMRLGWDEEHKNAVTFAQMLEQAGADLLTVHGRTRQQQYAGKADWNMIVHFRLTTAVYTNIRRQICVPPQYIANPFRIVRCPNIHPPVFLPDLRDAKILNTLLPYDFLQLCSEISPQCFRPPVWEHFV